MGNAQSNDSAEVEGRNGAKNVDLIGESTQLDQIVPYLANNPMNENDEIWSSDGVMGGLFSTRKPKDAVAGLSSGLKTVGKGVAAGVVSLFAAPVVGATNEGVAGFFKGFGGGVLAAVTLPVTAVGVAGYQVIRGVVNTPEAITEKTRGKKWDSKRREWKTNFYSLDKEAAEVLAANKDLANDNEVECGPKPSCHSPKEEKINRKVVDTKFYDLLSVSPNSSQSEIRKQYYRLAKQYHPDKNPNDEDAKVRFQKLGEAYQILGDDERRRQYDLHGESATHDVPFIDSSLIFMMLFGSEGLEPYVGKFKMAMIVEAAEKSSSSSSGISLSEDLIEFEQRKREVLLALELRNKLQPFVLGNEEEVASWHEKIVIEADKLCSSSFGDTIVEAIGWGYQNYAEQFIGKLDTFLGISGRYAKMQAKTRSVGNAWRTATTVLRTAVATQKLQKSAKNEDVKLDEDEGKNGQEAVKNFEEALPLILETMLQIAIMDIESTVRMVAKKVLKDMDVDIEVRRQRAEALIEIGIILQQAAHRKRMKSGTEKVDARRHMEEAFIKAAAKADEQCN